MAKSGSKTNTGPSVSEIEKRWSKPLVQAGWTAIPSVIIQRQKALGLDALDVNILIYLATYWWKAGHNPYPSKATIAETIGVDKRTVQRRIAAMEGAGLIRRKMRYKQRGGQNTNEYTFDGLINEATPFAQEEIEKRQARGKEDKERARRKKPDLKVVKS